MKFIRKRLGATTTEQGLLLGLIAVALILSISGTGTEVSRVLGSVSNGLIGKVPEPPASLSLPSFAAIPNASSNLLVTSSIGAVGGTGTVTGAISNGGNFRLCADATCASVKTDWTVSAPITAGDYLQLRGTAPASNGETRAFTLTANEASVTWNVTTTFLYSFSSHTFNNCGQSGRSGPNLNQCRNTYSTSWDNNSSFFSMPTNGYQLWTVPETATYRITAAGAQGGISQQSAGRGAILRADFALTQGDQLLIAVGQRGQDRSGDTDSGGGGGSFVALGNSASSATPLIVAGGGGGSSSDARGYDGAFTRTASNGACTNNAQGAGGGTGCEGSSSPSGAGFNSNGYGACGAAAQSFRSGLTGGSGNHSWGGFGGGAGGCDEYGNGAGGYTGSRGSDQTGTGGAGSYVDTSAQNSTNVGANGSHGYVSINKL